MNIFVSSCNAIDLYATDIYHPPVLKVVIGPPLHYMDFNRKNLWKLWIDYIPWVLPIEPLK